MDDTELNRLQELVNKATPGPWYPRATDDDKFMNALYVCSVPGPRRPDEPNADLFASGYHGLMFDGGNSMAYGFPDQAQSDSVIAITLLQSPRLADNNECDENTEFIAAARTAVPQLLMEVFKLRQQLVMAQQERDKWIAIATKRG